MDSRPVTSNQTGPHPDLFKLLQRHANTPWQKPISGHTRSAFEQAGRWLSDHSAPVILDSGCGTGESTIALAKQNPNCSVIGIDQSAARLRRNCELIPESGPDNCLLVRAEAADFWRLLVDAGWDIQKHYLLYPNPWPKKAQLARRWHGHPVFPILCGIRGEIELRSNWQLYAEEFSTALTHMNRQVDEQGLWQPSQPLTPFEAKYQSSGHPLFRVLSSF